MPSLPLEFEHDPDDPACAVPVVAAMVCGRPYRFVVDTGAARTTMVADEYTSGLAVCGQGSSHGAFAPVSDPLVTVTDLRAGPLRAGELVVSRAGAARPGVGNLLGMDVLRHYRCRFRFGAGVVDVDEPDGGPGTGDLRADAAWHPFVELVWPGVTANACWDSGAGVTVVDRGFWQANRGLFEETGRQTGTDASGTGLETVMVRAAPAVIGGLPFAAHQAAVVDLTGASGSLERPMDLILGYPAWRQADWLFDFPARRWAVTAPGAAGEPG